MKKNSIIQTDIKTDSATGRRSYPGALTGIDVSRHNGVIDFELVKKDGIDFCFVRAGTRHFNDGSLIEDIRYRENVNSSIGSGIDTGVYFFSSAINEKEIAEEADFVLEHVQLYNITLPLVLDMEIITPDCRMVNLSPKERTDLVLIFKEKVEKAGYIPMFYCNSIPRMMSFVELERMENLEKWIAEYRFKPYFRYDFAVWQYSCTGKVKGIEGDVDLDLAFRLPRISKEGKE